MLMIDIKYFVWLKTSDKIRYINKANVTHIEKKFEQRNIDKTED